MSQRACLPLTFTLDLREKTKKGCHWLLMLKKKKKAWLLRKGNRFGSESWRHPGKTPDLAVAAGVGAGGTRPVPGREPLFSCSRASGLAAGSLLLVQWRQCVPSRGSVALTPLLSHVLWSTTLVSRAHAAGLCEKWSKPESQTQCNLCWG